MKNVKLILVLFILTSCAGSEVDKKNTFHIGEWEGLDFWNNAGEIVLNSKNYASLVINGEQLGGENFEVKGVKSELRYTIDYSKTPIWIDFVLYKKDSTIEQGEILGIIEFLNTNEARLLLNSDGKRHLNFNKEHEKSMIRLTKKQKTN